MEKGFPLLLDRVFSALSSDECKAIRFLVSDLLSAECVDFRRAFLTLNSHTHSHTHTGQQRSSEAVLKEILFTMKRFDVLKNILGTSRTEVEELLRTNGRVLSDYRVLMIDLSESLEEDELHSLTFLLSNTISKGPLERAKSLLDVVVELEKIGKVSCDELEMVEECLRKIRRVDLATRIQSYQRGGRHRSQREVSHRTQFGNQAPVRNQQRITEGLETLKLSVAETGNQRTEALVDEYCISSDVRGVCVIIDCIGCDGELLKQVFEQLGLCVYLHTLLSVGEVYSVLRSVRKQGALQQASIFCCCLLSRGSDSCLLATDAEGSGIPLTDLRQNFSPACCPLLAGKPKLFFTQSYTVASTTSAPDDCFLETDGVPFTSARETLPDGADVLWSVCRTEAWLLERRGHQSVYLQALRSALLGARESKINILDALTHVNRDVFEHNQRNPDQPYQLTLSHTLRKTLYL